MSQFALFVNSFPTAERTEINKLLQIVGANDKLDNIYKLSKADPVFLSEVLRTKTTDATILFNEFWTRVKSSANLKLQGVNVSDPENLSFRQRSSVARHIDDIFMEFGDLRTRSIKKAIVPFQSKDFVDYYENLLALDNSNTLVFDKLTDDYWNAASEYYIISAQNYVRNKSRDYTIVGQVVESKTNIALSRMKVRAGDDIDGFARNYGYVYTDYEGYFNLRFSVLEGLTAPRTIEIFISGRPLLAVKSGTISFDPSNPDELHTIPVVLPKEVSTSKPLSQVGFPVSSKLTTYFNNKQYTTLHDLRLIGGLQNASDLPKGTEADAKKLDAISVFELFSTDVNVNSTLYDTGYIGISSIGLESREEFVRKTSKNIGGDFEAARIHTVAKAALRYLTGHAVNESKGEPSSAASSSTLGNQGGYCNCEDCSSAVSPLSYLTDLSVFATKTLKTSNPASLISLDWIESNFHLPISQLRLSCSALKEEICQNRLAVEALRSYHSSLGNPNQSALEIVEKQYLEDTYRTLLIGLGTNYEEIRSIANRSDIDDTQRAQELADRLEITDTFNDLQTIDTMFVDLSLEGSVSEGFLEDIFGLRDSNRDPLSEQPESKILLWKKAFLSDTWAQQDRPDELYPRTNRPKIDPDIITIDDFRISTDSALARQIWSERREWLDGTENTIDNMTVDGHLSFSAIVSSMVSNSFEWNNTPIQTGWEDRVGNPNIPFIEVLKDQYKNGEIVIGSSASPVSLENLGLNVQLAARIVQLYFQEDGFENVNTSEEQELEFRNIIIAVLKRLVFSSWISDEVSIDISPKVFWKPILEPKEGSRSYQWDECLINPLLSKASDLLDMSARTEYKFSTVDVDLEGHINESDSLIKTLSGQTNIDGLELLSARKTEATIRQEHIVSRVTFLDKIQAAFRTADIDSSASGNLVAIENFEALNSELLSPETSEDAVDTVTNTLKITVEDFRLIMSILSTGSNPSEIDNSQLNKFHQVLYGAYLSLWLIPAWRSQEQQSNVENWKIKKSQLPQWRSTQAERNDFQRTLLQNSSRPIIDPDVINVSDIKNVEEGNPAYDLLQSRKDAISGDIATSLKNVIENATGGNLVNIEDFNSLTAEILGLAESSLSELQVQLEGRIDIRKRLGQLGIDLRAFNFLMSVRDVLTSGNITQSERDGVRSILLSVLKSREFFDYRREERNANIVLSDEYFKIRDSSSFSEIEWISSRRDRFNWEKILKSRVEEYNSLLANHKEIIFKTDEQTIVTLRNGLVKAIKSETDEGSFEQFARSLGNRLLIDLQNQCCVKTNRVSAAVETIQQLLWKVRTGDSQGVELIQDLSSVADDFDEAWVWMGNYSNWRAAMFVFIYPENVLIPSLRNKQSNAFKKVIQGTRNNRRFNPLQACEIAKEFLLEMKEISELKVKCATQAEVVLSQPTCEDGSVSKQRVNMVFAQVGDSGKSYFSIVPGEGDVYSQNKEWTRIDLITEDVELVGSDVYNSQTNKVDHTYLFFLKKDKATRDTFFAIRFNNQGFYWEDEVLEFQIDNADLNNHVSWDLVPFDKENFNTEISSICIGRNSNFYSRPAIAVSLLDERTGRYFTFTRRLAPDGKELASEYYWDKWFTNYNWRAGLVTTITTGTTTEIQVQTGGGSQVTGGVGTQTITIDGETIEQVAITPSDFYGGERGKNDFNGLVKEFVIARPTGDWRDNRSYFILESEGDLNQESKILEKQIDGSIFTGLARVSNSNSERVRHILNISDGYEPRFIVASSSGIIEFAELENASNDIFPKLMSYSEASEMPSVFVNSVLISNPFGIGERIDTIYSSSFDNGGTFITFFETDNSIANNTISENYLKLSFEFPQMPDFNSTTENNLEFLRAQSEESLLLNQNDNSNLQRYAKEIFYFLPMQIALQLHATKYYQESLDWFRMIYDYGQAFQDRKVFYGLVQEETGVNIFNVVEDWYKDPLNPHAVASSRRHAYTRYTILSIAKCMLSYADAEFTKDTSESVPIARELYESASALLTSLQTNGNCNLDEVIEEFEENIADEEFTLVLRDVLNGLEDIDESQDTEAVENAIRNAVQNGSSSNVQKISAIKSIINNASISNASTLVAKLNIVGKLIDQRINRNGSTISVEMAVGKLTQSVNSEFTRAMSFTTGIDPDALPSKPLKWLAGSKIEGPAIEERTNPYLRSRERSALKRSGTNPNNALKSSFVYPDIYFGGSALAFCTAPNPIVEALLMSAYVNLFKIHNCMNIAGMRRELSPFSAPIDATSGVPSIGVGGSIQIPTNLSIPPSNYRYAVIAERAKQLVSMAQQIESSFLFALEKFDGETYSKLRAEQDIETSKANIKLQGLKIKEAQNGEKLAELQRDRSVLQRDGLQGMIDEGILDVEQEILNLYTRIQIIEQAKLTAQFIQQNSQALVDVAQVTVGKLALAPVYTAQILALSAGFAADQSLIGAQGRISRSSIFASFERRKQEWEFQKSLSNQDIQIGNQQIKLAKDRLRIVGQEKAMVDLQNQHAESTLDFLKNKFTSAELYEWMSGILEDVYSFFLQEATAMAIMAQRQLAFERQVDLPPFIRNDYWNLTDTSGINLNTGEGDQPDRRGITGSARLLKDLYDLDQFAFNSNTPKLQLSKTVSLNEIEPLQLQNLRENGVMSFMTTKDMFDRDYPGHYLRLIKRVSVSVVALNSPIKGIKATLSNLGVSRTVTGAPLFQNRTIFREPEQQVLSSGTNDYGVFQLEADGQFLNSFEGHGIESSWEFRMDKAANPFNYQSIADVLITIEYEALSDFSLRSKVAKQFNLELTQSVQLAISMKNNLPDQWFDLYNPDQSETPFEVGFQLKQNDIPVNLSDPTISSINLAFELKESSTSNPADFQGVGVEKVEGNEVVGDYLLQIGDNNVAINAIENDEIEDILIVITYSGTTIPYSE